MGFEGVEGLAARERELLERKTSLVESLNRAEERLNSAELTAAETEPVLRELCRAVIGHADFVESVIEQESLLGASTNERWRRYRAETAFNLLETLPFVWSMIRGFCEHFGIPVGRFQPSTYTFASLQRIASELSGADAAVLRARFEAEGLPTKGFEAAPAYVAVSSVSSTAIPTSSTFAFPPPILDAFRRDKLAVLFGSGLSLARDVTGNFPRWNELLNRFWDQAVLSGVWTQAQVTSKRAFCQSGHLSLESMLVELDAVKIALRNARKYQSALNAVFRPRNAESGAVHRALEALGVSVLATTNYDELYEHAEGHSARKAYTWKDADKVISDIQEDRRVLFKIHGTAEHEGTIVLTRTDYAEAVKHEPYQRVLSFLLQTYTFLLVGYGINDPLDLDLVFSLNAFVFGSSARTHYALMKEVSPADRDRWQRDLNVQVVPYQNHDDLPSILSAVRTGRS